MHDATILILAPHTDDGELGCGGTIAKYARAGATIYYAAFSTCERSLPDGFAPDTLVKEVNEATKILGIKEDHLMIYNYDVRTFKRFRQEILDELILLRNQIKPTHVFLPASSDIHQDHQVIAEEGFRAFKHTTVYGYELPWNNPVFKAQAFSLLTQADIDLKIKALYAYRSQAHRAYLSENFILSLATVRGTQVSTPLAEAFEVVRVFMP